PSNECVDKSGSFSVIAQLLNETRARCTNNNLVFYSCRNRLKSESSGLSQSISQQFVTLFRTNCAIHVRVMILISSSRHDPLTYLSGSMPYSPRSSTRLCQFGFR